MDLLRRLCYFRLKPIGIMKNLLLPAAALALCSFVSAQAQPGMMGAPHGPDFSGATGKLFGVSSNFSANLGIQTAQGSDTTSLSGSIAVSDGKSRFEMDMTKITGSGMNPQQAAQMQAMGMGSLVMISRPDLKLTRMVYPGMNAYVETPTSDTSSSGAPGSYKTDITKLGEETVDGHPCVKNKATVTDDKGNTYESTVWNATDLKNFPVKIEQNQGGTTMTMTFKDIKLEKPAADKFDAPAGATKYDNMGTMMQQEMMKRAMQGRGQP
jgi:hypothetical protein